MEPRPQQKKHERPPKDELGFLRWKAAQAQHALQVRAQEAPRRLRPLLSIERWGRHHPWVTVSAAFAAGLASTRLVPAATAAAVQPGATAKQAAQSAREKAGQAAGLAGGALQSLARAASSQMGLIAKAALVAALRSVLAGKYQHEAPPSAEAEAGKREAAEQESFRWVENA